MKARFTYTAGFLVQNYIKSELRKLAFLMGLDIDIKRFGGIIESDYGVIIKGEKSQVRKYVDVATSWMKKCSY